MSLILIYRLHVKFFRPKLTSCCNTNNKKSSAPAAAAETSPTATELQQQQRAEDDGFDEVQIEKELRDRPDDEQKQY